MKDPDPDEPVEIQGPRVYKVSTLTAEIRDLLETRFPFVWVEGEISNMSVPSSGHWYMALKDESAQIRAVMFRPRARTLRFRAEDGMKVIVHGRVGLYEPRGEYQLVLDYMEPLGVGALALAYEQLKQKLASEGLFRKEIKRPIPFLPSHVAVITSPTGAAVRDFLNVVQRRFGNIRITILPVRVQGDAAAGEIIEAIGTANEHLDADVIVLTRGGGSMEDLWPFNDEGLARSIRSSGIPIVSAVGHEIDTTIADLAADLRAPTPSAAAELIVSEKEQLAGRLAELRMRLRSAVKSSLARHREKVVRLEAGIKDPRKTVQQFWIRLDDFRDRLTRSQAFLIREKRAGLNTASLTLYRIGPGNRIQGLTRELEFLNHSLRTSIEKSVTSLRHASSSLEGRLKSLDPLGVLRRGYSITRTLPEGRVLKESTHVREGDRVEVTLAEGVLHCRIDKAGVP